MNLKDITPGSGDQLTVTVAHITHVLGAPEDDRARIVVWHRGGHLPHIYVMPEDAVRFGTAADDFTVVADAAEVMRVTREFDVDPSSDAGLRLLADGFSELAYEHMPDHVRT